jgi:magnesium-transporting ATPase (P-type)
MSQVITSESFRDFVSKNEFQITFNINKNPRGLSIRIPPIKEEQIEDVFYDEEDGEMRSPEPKKRKVEHPENDDNSKKRRHTACPWLLGVFLFFFMFMIMLPETLASDFQEDYVIDQKCSDAVNWTMTCVVLTVSASLFCSAIEDEDRRGITMYSNFKMLLAVVVPVVVYIYS